MLLNILRGLFILLMAAVAWHFVTLGRLNVAITVGLAILFVCIDILSPRRKLVAFSAMLFGLIVGLAITFILHFVIELLVDLAIPMSEHVVSNNEKAALVNYITLVVALVACYLSISFVMQTKDDVRFIIPYVEFTKKVKGVRPTLVDTSALIDGRISDIASTGFLDSQLVVPKFVLQELQAVADSGDKLKRNRGRRGLDVLTKLRNTQKAEVIFYEQRPHAEEQGSGGGGGAGGSGAGGTSPGVDELLMSLAKELNAKVLTTDYNLNKVAQLRGVDVVNVNDLVNALRPVVLPGERMGVRLVKPGEAAGQGVGYLEDGTMVVVEHGRSHLNEEVEFTVTSALQTSAGRMIFGRISGEGPSDAADSAPPTGRGGSASRRSTPRGQAEPSSQEMPSK